MEMVSIYKRASDSDKHMSVGPNAETVSIFHLKIKNEIISHMKHLVIKFKSTGGRQIGVLSFPARSDEVQARSSRLKMKTRKKKKKMVLARWHSGISANVILLFSFYLFFSYGLFRFRFEKRLLFFGDK